MSHYVETATAANPAAFRSLAAATGRPLGDLAAAAKAGTLAPIIRAVKRQRELEARRTPASQTPHARGIQLEALRFPPA